MVEGPGQASVSSTRFCRPLGWTHVFPPRMLIPVCRGLYLPSQVNPSHAFHEGPQAWLGAHTHTPIPTEVTHCCCDSFLHQARSSSALNTKPSAWYGHTTLILEHVGTWVHLGYLDVEYLRTITLALPPLPTSQLSQKPRHLGIPDSFPSTGRQEHENILKCFSLSGLDPSIMYRKCVCDGDVPRWLL